MWRLHFVIGYLNAFKEKMMYLNVPQAYIETAMMTHAAELIHEFYHAARYITDDKQKFDEWFGWSVLRHHWSVLWCDSSGHTWQT